MQKVKKEKPELDEEMRAAQQKYEETLLETEQLMISLNERDEAHVTALESFLQAQLDYHQRCSQILEEIKANLQDP